MEYASTIWDTTTKADAGKLERFQRKAAQWTCGKYGIMSITQLLKDLKWADLADRRRDQRIILFYKILNSHLTVPLDELDIVRAPRPARLPKNQDNLVRPTASYKASPLWTSTVFRTIPEWNSLPASIAEADTVDTFKCRLAARTP